MTEASVVICAHTLARWDELRAAVASVRAQTWPAQEILVVTDYNDALRERAESAFEGVRVVPNTKDPGLSGGRMTGADLIRADVVVFLDDDAIADPRWLEELLEAYSDPQVLGAGGPVEPLWRAPPPSWFPSEFHWVIGCTYDGMPVEAGRIRNPIGASMSVRRDVLFGAGGFASHMGRQKAGFSISGKARAGGKAESCEETEFCIRAAQRYPGGYFTYRPGARVLHVVPAERGTWRYFVNRCLVEGTAKGILTELTGTENGLGSEARYVREVLPRAILRNLGAALRGNAGGARRALAIVAGLAVTTFAYGMTRAERRGSRSMRMDAAS